jgi:hypothetical protein
LIEVAHDAVSTLEELHVSAICGGDDAEPEMLSPYVEGLYPMALLSSSRSQAAKTFIRTFALCPLIFHRISRLLQHVRVIAGKMQAAALAVSKRGHFSSSQRMIFIHVTVDFAQQSQ